MIVRKNNIQHQGSSYIDELRSLLHNAGDSLSSAAERIGHDGRATGSHALSGLRDAGSHMGDAVVDGWDYVRERPRSSAIIGTAIGVGLLAGFLLWRRNHN